MRIENKKKRKKLTHFSRNQLLNLLELLFWIFAACGVAGATGGDLVATALAFGLVIVAMAYSIGRISGRHINPAVSLGCLLTKRMTVKEFFAYVCAQILGGTCCACCFGFQMLA